MVDSVSKVSIIMPVYSAARTIEQAVSSVISQSYDHWELIIINDNCPENSCDSILHIIDNDDRIIKIDNEKNIGVSKSRNKGINIASGDIIAFLDSDDYWVYNKLENQIEKIQDGCDVVCSNYIRIYENGRQSEVAHKEMFFYSDMLKSNQIGNLTGIYNCKKIGKIYQEDVGHEDYVMWLQVVKKSKKNICIQEPLAYYRVSGHSVSSNKLKTVIWQWKIYRKALNFNLLKSLWLLVHYIYFAGKKRKKATQ